MNNQYNINLRSIKAFKNITDSSLEIIRNNATYIEYDMGKTIINNDTIPNKIFIILSGNARLLFKDKSTFGLASLALLKTDDFIGLASLLRAQGCEHATSSNKLLVMSLPDITFIRLYQDDIEFQNWCNKKIQVSELYDIAINLHKTSLKSDKELKSTINLLIDNIEVTTLNNNQSIELRDDCIEIVGSANVLNKKIGDLLTNNNEKFSTQGPFPARIFQLPKKIYNQIINPPTVAQNDRKEENLEISEITRSDDFLENTNEKIGQYSPNKEFKFIKANGILRESIACLQMLANELDLPFKEDSIEKILRESIRRGNNPSIQMLGSITSMMGLHSSGAKIDPKMANRLPSPSLIAWGESFALVKNSPRDCLEIASPSQGIIRIPPKEFEKHFDKGFIDLLLVEKNEQTPEQKFGINWLLPSIIRYRGVLLQVLLASFVVQLLGLANPLMIQIVIDKVFSQRSLDTLQVLGIALVFATILGGVLSSLRTFLFAETTNRIDTRLGAEVIDHLLKLPLNYFDRRPVGELGSRVAELEKIRNFLTGQALTTILDAAFSLIYIIVMVIYSWLLSIVALGVIPIQILIIIIGTPLIRRQIREVAVENASTQSHLIEVLNGIQTVKAQNVERISRWKWQELYSGYISKSFQRTITGTALGETSMVLQQLSQLLVLWIGATLVLNGELSLGQLIAFRIISGYVTQPLLRLSSIWQNVQELRVSFERLADIIDTPQEASELDKAKIPLPSIDGSVEFDDVSFKFKRNQVEVLKNINLKIKQGQFIGIVGQSGSGKSTLMKLLPRLYKPNSGRILIDGYDIDKVELYSLRRQIGIVPQEPLLFAGSVNHNIALTDPDSSSDDIVHVSKIADAHDFIMQLQDGYSTDVGERGSRLSGGQKQRIAIARTLLSNPKLLIMDEATSALDYETERRVCEGLRKYCDNSTVFFITHRLSTVKNSDLIIMLDKGAIVETGTHTELMQLKGRYFALYLQQESS